MAKRQRIKLENINRILSDMVLNIKKLKVQKKNSNFKKFRIRNELELN